MEITRQKWNIDKSAQKIKLKSTLLPTMATQAELQSLCSYDANL